MGFLRGASMSYGEMESVGPTEALLKEAGFTVSQTCCARPSCFDFAARKNESLVFVKVQPDIDNLSINDATDLRKISQSVSAASLLISKKCRDKPLEDDTIYSRYNVSAITTKTFENIVTRKSYPLIQACPGGYYVEIDGSAIRRRRQELGLSVGEIAKMIGISRRTLYGYERSMAKASIPAAYNLICTLGVPVAKSVDVFEKYKNENKCAFLSTARRVFSRSKLLTGIFKKFERCNITVVRKAPFDFVITAPDEKILIIGGISNVEERDFDKRIDEILSVSNVVKAHPIMITDGKKPINKDISCIREEELSNIKNPKDLIVKAT